MLVGKKCHDHGRRRVLVVQQALDGMLPNARGDWHEARSSSSRSTCGRTMWTSRRTSACTGLPTLVSFGMRSTSSSAAASRIPRLSPTTRTMRPRPTAWVCVCDQGAFARGLPVHAEGPSRQPRRLAQGRPRLPRSATVLRMRGGCCEAVSLSLLRGRVVGPEACVALKKARLRRRLDRECLRIKA